MSHFIFMYDGYVTNCLEWFFILDLDSAKKTKTDKIGTSASDKYLFELYFILKERTTISAVSFQSHFYICVIS